MSRRKEYTLCWYGLAIYPHVQWTTHNWATIQWDSIASQPWARERTSIREYYNRKPSNTQIHTATLEPYMAIYKSLSGFILLWCYSNLFTSNSHHAFTVFFSLSILSLALSVSLRIQRTFMYSINRVFHYFREQSIEMRFFSTHLFYRVYIFYRRLIIADGQWFHTRKESRWQRETCLSKSERLAVGIFLPAICERTSTRIAHSLR